MFCDLAFKRASLVDLRLSEIDGSDLRSSDCEASFEVSEEFKVYVG